MNYQAEVDDDCDRRAERRSCFAGRRVEARGRSCVSDRSWKPDAVVAAVSLHHVAAERRPACQLSSALRPHFWIEHLVQGWINRVRKHAQLAGAARHPEHRRQADLSRHCASCSITSTTRPWASSSCTSASTEITTSNAMTSQINVRTFRPEAEKSPKVAAVGLVQPSPR